MLAYCTRFVSQEKVFDIEDLKEMMHATGESDVEKIEIVSSLASGRPIAAAAALALGTRPADLLQPSSEPEIPQEEVSTTVEGDFQDSRALTLLSTSSNDEERGPQFQAHKAAFFFKLERELEKVRL